MREGVKMRRCEDEKMRYRPPLLEEPCAQTLSGTKRRKLPRFVLCFTVRFTVFHSAVRVSLHPTALRVFHFLFAVSWVGGAAIV